MTMLLGIVLVLSALSLYRTGRITSDKMALQNAADAMVYSISTVEACDLNFAAYLNKAMVANEVAIGQATGMASWAWHWESIGDFLLEYDNFLKGPTLRISTTVLTPLAAVFTIPANAAFKPLMNGYAKAMTAVNFNVNRGYGIAQQIYHLTSIINALGLIDESIEANAPNDAQMSAYGVLMLIAHLGTYGGLPMPAAVTGLEVGGYQPFAPFTESYNPGAAKTDPADLSSPDGSSDTYGFGRLSAMIHNSGDPFTKGWHNPPYHEDENLTGRGWVINFFELMRDAGLMPAPTYIGFDAGIVSGGGTFGVFDEGPCGVNPCGDGWLGFEMGGGIDTPIGGASIDFYIKIRMRMLREGGSEIRAVIPVVSSPTVSGESFSWSSADATNFDLGFAGGGGFEAWITIPIIDTDITIIDIDFDIVVADEHMTIGFSFGGSESGCFTETDADGNEVETCEEVSGDADVVIYDGSFPTSAPLGASFVHSGTTGNTLTVAPQHMGTDIDAPVPSPGPIPGDAYGKAAMRMIAWYYAGLVAQGIYWQPVEPTRNLTNKYKGLPRYIDTTGAEPVYKSGGPFLVTGLKLNQTNFDEEHYDDAGADEPTGRLELEEAFGWDDMTAIAKSEVYFKRPLDLDYFARGDGYVEHGSAFNPYWQARLIETSHADRVMALLLQHGELAQGISFGADIDALAEWMQSALGGL